MSARGHREQGRPRGSSQAQPKVEITKQVHDYGAGLRPSQEVNLQVRVRSSRCWADPRFQLGRQFIGSAGCIDRQGTTAADLETKTPPEKLRKEANTQGWA